jgi:hypothetical protein
MFDLGLGLWEMRLPYLYLYSNLVSKDTACHLSSGQNAEGNLTFAGI